MKTKERVKHDVAYFKDYLCARFELDPEIDKVFLDAFFSPNYCPVELLDIIRMSADDDPMILFDKKQLDSCALSIEHVLNYKKTKNIELHHCINDVTDKYYPEFITEYSEKVVFNILRFYFNYSDVVTFIKESEDFIDLIECCYDEYYTCLTKRLPIPTHAELFNIIRKYL